MRVLMLVPQFFYTPRGTPLSAYHRTRELLELGYEVDILTYGLGEDPPELEAKVYRSRGPHFSSKIKQGPSYLKIWFDFLFALNLVVRLCRGRYDLMYGHEEGAFMAAVLGPIFRTPYVYDMHSSLPRQIIEWKFSRNRFVLSFFRWVERFTVRRARAIVAISPGVADAARQAVPGAHVITIVNRFDLNPQTPRAAGHLREDLELDANHRVVLYTGSFVELQALDLLLDSVSAVVERVAETRFVLVGGVDPELTEIREAVAARGLEGLVLVLAARPQEQMPIFMDAADVLVSPRVVGINPPGKLFSYLESGRPVVATDTLVHNQILSHDCAFLTRPDAAGLAAGLVQALVDGAAVERVLRGAAEVLEDSYGPRARAEAYTMLDERVRAGA